jgi:hypothetical protein
MPDQVQIIAEKLSTVTFTVPNGTRSQIEDAIAERLRSDTELLWVDSPNGIRVICISPNGVWRPRRRFSTTDDDDSHRRLLIENQSAARPNGEGEQ